MGLSRLKKQITSLLDKVQLKKLVRSEFIQYGFWGVVTSLLNIGVFQLALMLGLNYIAANAISLVLAKSAAYITSKFFVFHRRCASKKELFVEIFRYIYTRGATMLLDFFGLMLFVEVFHADKLISKCIVTFLVILTNYFLGKFHVFRKSSDNAGMVPVTTEENEDRYEADHSDTLL